MEEYSRNQTALRMPAGRLLPLFFMLIAALLVVLSIYAVRFDVELVVNGESRKVTTFSRNVAGLLDEAGITVGDWDKLSHDLKEKLTRDMTVRYTAAFPVPVRADGEQRIAMAAEASVADVLKDLGISLGELDRVEPNAEYLLSPGDEINVVRVLWTLLTERTELPFREIRHGNPELDRGVTRILQRGSVGIREDTVKTIFENGVEISTEILHSELIRPREDRIVEVGENTVLSRGGRTVRFERVFTMSATAYCAGIEASGCPVDEQGRSVCTGSNNDGITASGKRAVAGSGSESSPHMVAIDPKVIPLGSRLYIDGYGYAVATDTGSAITGTRIDLLLPTHEAARRFGRRTLRVYLLSR